MTASTAFAFPLDTAAPIPGLATGASSSSEESESELDEDDEEEEEEDDEDEEALAETAFFACTAAAFLAGGDRRPTVMDDWVLVAEAGTGALASSSDSESEEDEEDEEEDEDDEEELDDAGFAGFTTAVGAALLDASVDAAAGASTASMSYCPPLP